MLHSSGIWHWTTYNNKQQTRRHNYNQNTGLIQLRERIIDFMVDEGYWPDGVRPTILEKHLRLAIIAIKNLKNDPKDTRTPDKWIKRMLLAGIIKKYGVHMYVFCNAEEDLMANQQTSALTPVERSQQSTSTIITTSDSRETFRKRNRRRNKILPNRTRSFDSEETGT